MRLWALAAVSIAAVSGLGCSSSSSNGGDVCGSSSGDEATLILVDDEPGGSVWYDPADDWTPGDPAGDDGSDDGSQDPGSSSDDDGSASSSGDDDTSSGDDSSGDDSSDDSGDDDLESLTAPIAPDACVACAIACTTDDASTAGRAYTMTLASERGYDDACDRAERKLARWIHSHVGARVTSCRVRTPSESTTMHHRLRVSSRNTVSR